MSNWKEFVGCFLCGWPRAPGGGFGARFLALFLPSWEVVSAIPDAHSGPHWDSAVFFIRNLCHCSLFQAFNNHLVFFESLLGLSLYLSSILLG